MILINNLKKNFEKDIYKNILILFSGSSIAQLIPLLATLLLTRIFTKEQFGVFFIYSSLCMVFSMVISLKLELAIVLPSKKDDGRLMFLISLIVSATLSLLAFIIISFFYDSIAKIFGERSLGTLLYLLPISLFLLGIIQSCSYWFNRNNNFKNISIAKITKSTFSSIIQIGLGLASFLKYGLVVGLISGQLATALYSLYFSFKNKVVRTRDLSFEKMFNLVNKYKAIPLFNTSIAVSNTLSNHLPIFLLTSFYSLEITAFYGLANRIIATPMSLLSSSVGEVFYNEATKRFNNGENLRRLVISSYKKLTKIAIIPSLLLLFLAPVLFTFFFGADWKQAGIFAQIIIPWLFLGFLNYPISYIFTILNKQKQLLVYNILLLIFRFLALFAGFKVFQSVTYTIAFFAFIGVLFNIFLLFYIIKISNTSTNLQND